MNAPSANAYEYSPVDSGPKFLEMTANSTRPEKSAVNRQADNQNAFFMTIMTAKPAGSRRARAPERAWCISAAVEQPNSAIAEFDDSWKITPEEKCPAPD